MIVVLYSRCNFAVVVGGCKYHIYLHLHFDQKSERKLLCVVFLLQDKVYNVKGTVKKLRSKNQGPQSTTDELYDHSFNLLIIYKDRLKF